MSSSGSTARVSETLKEFQQAFTGRVMALAKTHSLLTDERWQAVPLADLIRAEVVPYDDASGNRIKMRGPEVKLPPDLALPFGMAIHEMTTNAVKYGALSDLGGVVRIDWDLVVEDQQQKLQFAWVERNGPAVEVPTRKGFGSRLLDRVLTAQIHAEVTTDYRPEGLQIHLVVPLPDPP